MKREGREKVKREGREKVKRVEGEKGTPLPSPQGDTWRGKG
jgi:hypothetical protein